MLAPHSAAKRKTCADGALTTSTLTSAYSDYPSYPTSVLELLTSTNYSAKEWSWSSANPFFPACPDLLSSLSKPCRRACRDERARGFFPTAIAGTAFGDMPAKRRRPRQSSDAENCRMSDLEVPIPPKLRSSRSNKNNHGPHLVVRPFQRENPPRLVANLAQDKLPPEEQRILSWQVCKDYQTMLLLPRPTARLVS